MNYHLPEVENEDIGMSFFSSIFWTSKYLKQSLPILLLFLKSVFKLTEMLLKWMESKQHSVV